MRGLSPTSERERGATTVMIGIVAVSLLAMGAFVFDWGALLHERRQLQNGADAAALAVAEDCAYDVDDCEATGDGVAKGLVDPNAEDGVSELEDVEILSDDQTVTVVSSTLDEEGRSFVRFFFGKLLTDDEGKTVEARATAEWGGIGAASTVPLTFPDCAWDLATDFGSDLPSDTVTIRLLDPGESSNDCEGGTAGHLTPGNWGWLGADDCKAETTVGSWFEGSSGNSNPSTLGCDPSDFPIGEPILFPIFDEVQGSGANAEYHVIGYAAFELEAYRLHGNPQWREPNGYRCPGGGPPSVNCITGRFVEFVDLDAVLDPNADDFGARTVALVE